MSDFLPPVQQPIFANQTPMPDDADQYPVNPMVHAVIHSLFNGAKDLVTGPGQLSQANPYPPGSEEGIEFERTRYQGGQDWANNAALSTMRGGVVGGAPVAAGEVALGSGPIRKIYRGEYSGNKGGNFWTGDPEFAQQFTQSGQAHEVLSRGIDESHIHVPDKPIYAGDPDAVDIEIAKAKAQGKKAVELSEGQGQPNSVFVFDKTAIRPPPIFAKEAPVASEPGGVIKSDMAKFNSLDELRNHWTQQGVRNYVSQHPTTGTLQLNDLVVPKEARSSGVGSRFMNDLTDFADSQGRTVTLTPDKSYGATSVGRLKDFYKRFGFVENKGRNTDFTISDSMCRPPSKESK